MPGCLAVVCQNKSVFRETAEHLYSEETTGSFARRYNNSLISVAGFNLLHTRRMANNASNEDLLDFSRPWELSDAVLVVEREKFHVHRWILAMWSPVFSRMFNAEFEEKTAKEIPLPGKKASEIKELLLMMYPKSTRQINESNYDFLLDLAKEYMMTQLTEKCESYLLTRVYKPVYGHPYSPTSECLDLLVIAQEYELEKLQSACIRVAQSLFLSELKSHKMFEKISFSNYRKIVEWKIEELEKRHPYKDRTIPIPKQQ